MQYAVVEEGPFPLRAFKGPEGNQKEQKGAEGNQRALYVAVGSGRQKGNGGKGKQVRLFNIMPFLTASDELCGKGMGRG